MKAYLFPGQGSQIKGMGKNLFDQYEQLTELASHILGYSIKELCLDDPKRQLNNTQFTQPALYVVNALSYYHYLDSTGIEPDFVAGHSLGEFNALLAAKSYNFETGLTLVKKRGELMSQASGGGMAAILDSSQEEIETILESNHLTSIELANYNTPTQIVISGLLDDMARAEHIFEQNGLSYYPLNTSGAFHSKHMQAAKDQYESFLKQFAFADLKIPVISNVSAKPYQQGEINQQLADQLTHSVQWSRSIQYLMQKGVTHFEEAEHSDMLTKMLVHINKPEPILVDPELIRIAESNNAPDKHSDRPNDGSGITQIDSEQAESAIRLKLQSAGEKVRNWNRVHPVGVKVKSTLFADLNLTTRTEAVVLFGHKAAVYMDGHNGYFDLDELSVLEES